MSLITSAVQGEHTMFLRIEDRPRPNLPPLTVYVMDCLECGSIPENSDRRIPKRLHEWTDCSHDGEAEVRFAREAVNHASHSSLWGQVQGLVGPFR
jgi:hypothetical protein